MLLDQVGKILVHVYRCQFHSGKILMSLEENETADKGVRVATKISLPSNDFGNDLDSHT